MIVVLERPLDTANARLSFGGRQAFALGDNARFVTRAVAHRVRNRDAAADSGGAEALALQDHDVPVRYRNIWVRRLGSYN